MLKSNNDNVYYNILYLLSCGVNNVNTDAGMISKMNMENLYAACKFHNLTAFVCMTLENADVDVSSKWKEAKFKSIRKNIMLDAEREKLLKFCEEKHIWYMPLKGVILKELYPQTGMRQMADNDILFDKNYQKDIHDYFIGHGYRTAEYKKGNHDVYEKAPVYNYEMHTSLFNASDDSCWTEYYNNVNERLILKDDNNEYGYHFSDEDFYIYFTAHTFKHYDRGGGAGIRTLLDFYIYNREKNLDYDYINCELEKLGISAFEKKVRQLGCKVFGTDIENLSENEQQMLEFFMRSGTYGTISNIVKKRMKTDESRIRYCLKRLLPDMKSVKVYHPLVYKHKILLPGYCVYRIIRGVTVRKERTVTELKILTGRKSI